MILVTGATGTVGRRVVELLAREGQQVRAMVRETEEAAAFEAMGVAALVGDVTRATDRAAALVNTDEVVACHSAYHDYSRPAIATVDGAATVDLIQDAAAAGVRHFTLLSHLGADRETLSQRFVAKRQAELALLGQPGMSFTILRAAPLMSELGRLPGLGAFQAPRSLLLFGSGESRVSPLSPADLALLASRAGRTEHARNETIAVGGPQVYSWRELGAVLERVEGERVRVWRLPRAILTALRWILGWIHPPAGDRLGYLEALYRQDFIGDPGRVGAIFGVGLEDFESWLRRAGGEAPSAPPDLSQERPPARHVEGAAPTRPLHEPGLETDEPSRRPEPQHERPSGELEAEPARAIEPASLTPDVPVAPVPPPLLEPVGLPAAEPTPPPPALEPPVVGSLSPEPLPEPPASQVETPPLTGSLSPEETGEPVVEDAALLPGSPVAPPLLQPDQAPSGPVTLEPPVAGSLSADASDEVVFEPVADPAPLTEPELQPEPAAGLALPDPLPLVEPLEEPEAVPGLAESLADPSATETASDTLSEAAAEPDETPTEADPAAAWGRQATFGEAATPADTAGKRPPVNRPQAIDDAVVDLDPDA